MLSTILDSSKQCVLGHDHSKPCEVLLQRHMATRKNDKGESFDHVAIRVRRLFVGPIVLHKYTLLSTTRC